MAGLTQNIVVLGSTGSIGCQTLEIARAFPERLRVIGLAAGYNLKLLSEQILEFKPRFVCFQGETSSLPHGNHEFMSPEEMVAHYDIHTVVAASSGSSGLIPLISAIKAGKTIALANKESLVTAGELVIPLVHRHHAQLRPVDSEHSAIWQCLMGETGTVSRIILTASGGPFRGYTRVELAEVTAEQALRHPSWKMGRKVTIDSSTLMNKGLEVIEAHWLFDTPFNNIEVLVHPQSVIHSMVEFVDGAIKAQLGAADMRLPIQYALSCPERWGGAGLPALDFGHTPRLDFEKPDYERFPCLKLAIDAGKNGGTYPAAMCAADEIAVDMFLDGRIKYNDIALLIEDVLIKHSNIANPDLDSILYADTWAREAVKEAVKQERLHC